MSHSRDAQNLLAGKWLEMNFMASSNSVIAKTKIFRHFGIFCKNNGIEFFNVTSFGNLLKNIFNAIETRSLTDDDGKVQEYYIGLKVKPESDYSSFISDEEIEFNHDNLEIEDNDMDDEANLYNGHNQKRLKHDESEVDNSINEESEEEGSDCKTEDEQFEKNEEYPPPKVIPVRTIEMIQNEALQSDQLELPTMPWHKLVNDASNYTPEERDAVEAFTASYILHCEEVMGIVYACQFQKLKECWLDYWSNSFTPVLNILKNPKIINAVAMWDDVLYEKILDTLLPTVITPIQGSLAMSIREFAKQLENWVKTSVSNLPLPFRMKKIELAQIYSSCLRGLTSLNHLAQAASAVLQNTDTLRQMSNDWAMIDFEEVRQQSDWAFDSEYSTLVNDLQSGLTTLLEVGCDFSNYTNWLTYVVESNVQGEKLDDIYDEIAIESMSELLLRWSFLTSLIIRDLTLRSAVSFGHFHLLRLLFDEYILFLVDKYKRKLMSQQLRIQAGST